MNERQLNSIKIPASKNYQDFKLGDSLSVRISKTGSKTFRSLVFDGNKLHPITFGKFPDIKLADAKKYNSQLKALAQTKSISLIKHELKLVGIANLFKKLSTKTLDEQEAFEEEEKTLFCDFVKVWVEHKLKTNQWKNPKTKKNNLGYLENHALPHLGKMYIEDITEDDIVSLLTYDDFVFSKYTTALKVKRNLQQIFALAKSRTHRLRKDNPADFSLEDEQLKPSYQEKPRGFLDPKYAPEIFQKLKDKDNLHDLCLAWQLLHICRPENAVEMEWHEIENINTNEFEISADKMKGENPSRWRSELFQPSYDILERLKKFRTNSSRLFPADTKWGHIDHNSPTRTLERVIGKENMSRYRHPDSPNNPTAHGIRHTFKTWATENNFLDEISEAQLAHRKQGMSKIYDHATDPKPRHDMMKKWNEFLNG